MSKFLIPAVVLPLLVVGYITVMGTTGACATCERIVNAVTGQQALEVAAKSTVVDTPIPISKLQPLMRVPIGTMDGKETTLARFAGKPMVIEVWATWCGPCRTVRKLFNTHMEELSSVATIIGVSVDEGGPKAVQNYLRKSPSPGIHEFMATPQLRNMITRHQGGVATTIPQVVYVAPDGRIVDVENAIPNPTFMIAMLKNLGQDKGTDG
ncbi:MAG: TlpA family protein disulfide reductase [Phycisphaerales bacterium]|nr:TlpA family protein disulfide reductase [Phycisphaerales bacterium]